MDYYNARHWGIRASHEVCAHHYGQPRVRIARLQSDGPDPQLIHLLPPQRGYLMSVHLQPLHLAELRVGGRQLPTEPWPPGTITLANLQDEPRASRGSSLDALLAYLPQAVFDDLAHEHDVAVDRLDVPWGAPDPIVAHLGACLLPALDAPEDVTGLFVDQLVLTLLAHLTDRYSGSPLNVGPRAGALAPWQLRRAKSMIEAHLTAPLTLAELARECNLSRSYFTRAFKRSTGTSPYRWLLDRRIDRAKQLLRGSALPLAEIALATGFSSQACFTRMFSRLVGTSPGAWRRDHHRHALSASALAI